MLRHPHAWALTLALTASVWSLSCSEDEEPSNPAPGRGGSSGSGGSAGRGGSAGSSGSSGSAGTAGTAGRGGSSGAAGSAGATGGSSGSGGSAGTATDAGTDASDAATDATADAPDDASTDTGDGGNLNVLYATFDGVLVTIDPDTGEEHDIGFVRTAGDAGVTYVDPSMTWSGTDPNTALMITSYNVTPTLATIDLCTARVTLGAALSNGAGNLVVEGIARHPNGTIYVTNGNPGNPNSPTSPRLGTVVVGTGVITNLPTLVTSVQTDTDAIVFRGTQLFGIDVATNVSRLDLYTLDLTTGADTDVGSPTYGSAGAVPLRIAYDASRDKAFSWRLSDRNLLEFDLTNGAVTPIGETHPSTSYRNQSVRAFFSAPPPRCP